MRYLRESQFFTAAMVQLVEALEVREGTNRSVSEQFGVNSNSVNRPDRPDKSPSIAVSQLNRIRGANKCVQLTLQQPLSAQPLTPPLTRLVLRS